jgi:hypothetical protein
MSPEELTDLIPALSPEDQAEVEAFILILKGRQQKALTAAQLSMSSSAGMLNSCGFWRSE